MLIIHSNQLTKPQLQQIETALNTTLHPVANHYQANISCPDMTLVKKLSEDFKIDINPLPKSFAPANTKLVISDMDSTLIGIECVDEIADMMNLKPQVSAITEAAMRGELNFESSLNQRVALLEGLSESALQKVYDERLFLNPGAEEWLAGLKSKSIPFALVSGGFTYFTDRLKQQLSIEFSRSNQLEINNGVLTGKIVGDIIGAEAKAYFLQELCDVLGIELNQAIAIGDGANDLLMMNEAGLSIAYHAKPAVQEKAATSLNFSGLDKVLDFINAEI
ncbi:phosphoserine phosphatase SerB [Hydrogenovibrio kuenenii]|uniref:phosphoserine phosphatase SerB n=1 Tax=Hydrogenovibrio kuenenii TaxID=63658 RepID=UPI00046774C4|nr:phosphoserine phosphatase SerB [Hydrogenovibrio kuenenii]